VDQIRDKVRHVDNTRANKKEKAAPLKDITSKLSNNFNTNVRRVMSAWGNVTKVPTIIAQAHMKFTAEDPTK